MPSVSNILINDGKRPMETGFGNGRLPVRLGISDQGAAFVYGVQVTFTLDGIDPVNITPERSVTFQTNYTEPNPKLAKLSPTSVQDIRNTVPTTKDDPNLGNVKRDGNKITVFDSPGPRQPIVMNDPKYYPIGFKGRFNLSLKHKPSGLTIARAEFYIESAKATFGAAATGSFTPISLAMAALNESVVQCGSQTSLPAYSISSWSSNIGLMWLGPVD